MEFDTALMGLAVYLLLWDKLPNWGTGFRTILAALPRPVQTLYRQWNCAYCSGFWIALGLHAVTGLWTIPALATSPGHMGLLGLPVNVFLNALASGTLIYVGNMALKALAFPILQAQVLREQGAASTPLKQVA